MCWATKGHAKPSRSNGRARAPPRASAASAAMPSPACVAYGCRHPDLLVERDTPTFLLKSGPMNQRLRLPSSSMMNCAGHQRNKGGLHWESNHPAGGVHQRCAERRIALRTGHSQSPPSLCATEIRCAGAASRPPAQCRGSPWR